MRIAIVGLGIAGLRAAMLLEHLGHEVQIFEARDRLGGRMHLVDQGGGCVYEAGGEWIDSDHMRCLALFGQLGMELERGSAQPRRYVAFGSACTESDIWPDALEDQLRFEGATREGARDLRQPPWANLGCEGLDKMNLAAFLDQQAHSSFGRWLLTAEAISDEGDDPDQIGLLGWLCFRQFYAQRQGSEMSAFRIQAGSSAALEKMSQSLGATPEMRKELVRVWQNAESVRLEFSDGTVTDVNRALLTLPPPALERVVFEPALSTPKRCAIEAARMSPVIKICLEFTERWWANQGWDGSMQCDLAVQQTWDASRGVAPVLTCYICGRAAKAFASREDAVEQAVEDLAGLYPQARSLFKRGWLHDWIHDPLSGGGFSQIPPGFVLEHMARLPEPENRIHFAGEHTSLWTGFIEGALESAERAAQEIDSAGL